MIFHNNLYKVKGPKIQISLKIFDFREKYLSAKKGVNI